MKLGSIDYPPDSIKVAEGAMVQQFGLNQQELTVFRAAAQSLRTVLQANRQVIQSITRANSPISQTDAADLAEVTSKRDNAITVLSNQILSTIRPETAQRLRATGDTVARLFKSTGGHN